MPFGLLPFILLFIPIAEIAVFIIVGGEIGILATFAMILFTAILGSILLRVQGLGIISKIQAKSAEGALPGKELVSGVMIAIAGVLLLTPGFVTDTIGFLLFFPPFRNFLWSTIASKVVVQAKGFTAGAGRGFDPFQQRRQPQEGVVDLDEDEYSEKPNPDSPWIDGNKK